MSSYIFYTIISVILVAISSILYVANKRYKRLSKKEKELLDKSLKKMGFFVFIILSLLMLSSVAGSQNNSIPDPTADFPLVVPADAAFKAESHIEHKIYDVLALSEEDAWRYNTNIFLDNNNTMVFINNSTIF